MKRTLIAATAALMMAAGAANAYTYPIAGKDFVWHDDIQNVQFDLSIVAPSVSKQDVFDGYAWDKYSSKSSQHKPDMLLEVNIGRNTFLYDGRNQYEPGKFGFGNMAGMVCKNTYTCDISVLINRSTFQAVLWEADRAGLGVNTTKMATFSSCDLKDGECTSDDGKYKLENFQVVKVNEF